MTDDSARKRRQKRKAWSADDIVDAVVGYVQYRNRPARIGRGNAIRLILGQPLKSGIIDPHGEMVTTVEIAEFKAWLFDSFFRVYGDRLAAGLGLMAEQKRRGQMGAEKRKEESAALAREIISLAENNRSTKRVADRNLAGMIAVKTGKHPSYIRRVLKKAR